MIIVPCGRSRNVHRRIEFSESDFKFNGCAAAAENSGDKIAETFSSQQHHINDSASVVNLDLVNAETYLLRL